MEGCFRVRFRTTLSSLPLGPKGFCCPLLAPPSPATRASFGYYTNMVQHIEFIIHTKFNPSGNFILPEVKGQGQKFKQIIVYAIT